ncbi:MAG: dihydrofolate reductase family protein [Chloroflexota bacterium]|nr:MAG: hypothetical protein DLM70_01580 [Chloroflexota bacterium]
MRKLINSTYVTLDGVVENVHLWPSLNGSDDTGTAIQTKLLLSCDAVLMGRKTYESFAGVWEGKSGVEYTDQMNRMTKYVVSSTLQKPTWNNTTVISQDVLGEVKRIKEQPGQDIVQYGFGGIAYSLMEHGLLDELRLWIHPFFFGNAEPQDLLFRKAPLTKFELIDTATLKSGIVILSYRVAESDNAAS